MAKITVPKPPKRAFNPQRPASGLLRDQVEHLEWAVRNAGERRRRYRVKPVRTEADVASRMAALLPKLASADRLPYETAEIPDDKPPVKRRSTPKRRRKSKRRTKR